MATARNPKPLPLSLIGKISALPPPARQAEVEDFVDFIAHKHSERALTRAAAASAPVFATIWNNPEDDVYDAL